MIAALYIFPLNTLVIIFTEEKIQLAMHQPHSRSFVFPPLRRGFCLFRILGVQFSMTRKLWEEEDKGEEDAEEEEKKTKTKAKKGPNAVGAGCRVSV